jgi:hypothetical protein
MKQNNYFSTTRILFILLAIIMANNLFYTQLFKEFEKTGNILFLIGGIVILFLILKAGLWF